MAIRFQLLKILADGRFHSGEHLGKELGVTRAAIWKQLQSLAAFGVGIQAVRGRGYRLPQPIEFLQVDSIRNHLPLTAQRLVAQLEIFTEIDSTNTYLKTQAIRGAESGSVCLSEWQHSGRGRQGRKWISPFGCNLYMSVLWRFNTGPAAVAGLSLVVGVALARVLRERFGPDVGLKWPNDLVWQGQKLAGILVEIAGEAAGPCHAVIGVGINVRMPDAAAADIGQPWIDLYRIARDIPPRNQLAAMVLEQLVTALQVFEQNGLTPFLEEWRDLDVMAGKTVQLMLPNGVVDGQAQGIDDGGAIIIQVGSELRRYASGEISLRMST